MAIALRKNYVTSLDEVFKKASLTAGLLADPATVQQGVQANEIMIPKLTMDGLADVSANGDLTAGDVSLEYETKAFNYERGRKFTVKQITNEETANVVFGKLASEFVRSRVVPEDDAFTFAKLAGLTGISKVASGATLSTGADVLAALRAATNAMDENEVPAEQRILYITPTLHHLVDDLDTTKSRAALDQFAQIVEVPQSRFYTAIDLYDGTTSGEEAGHYVKDANGKDINFMIIYKPAVMKWHKQTASDIITPKENQNGYGWIQKYMTYGIVEAYDNKKQGIYLHHKA